MNDLEIFKKDLIEATEVESTKPKLNEEIKLREQFNEEYPISRLRNMELEEYVTGRESEDSFCYKLEFGKYKDVGVGIGGAVATKFGIYYSKKAQCYKILGPAPKRTIDVEKPEEYWIAFRKELCDFLEECGKPGFSFDFALVDRYPKLSGMGMVLNKLCFIYYPDRFVNTTHKSSVFLFKKLGVTDYDHYDRVRMPFILANELKTKIPELFNGKYDMQAVGNGIWELIARDTSTRHSLLR